MKKGVKIFTSCVLATVIIISGSLSVLANPGGGIVGQKSTTTDSVMLKTVSTEVTVSSDKQL